MLAGWRWVGGPPGDGVPFGFGDILTAKPQRPHKRTLAAVDGVALVGAPHRVHGAEGGPVQGGGGRRLGRRVGGPPNAGGVEQDGLGGGVRVADDDTPDEAAGVRPLWPRT